MRPTPGMAIATLAGTLTYLAIAIAGWGGIAPSSRTRRAWP